MAIPAPNDIVAMRIVCWEPVEQQIGINVLHAIVNNITGIGATQLAIAQALDVAINGVYKAWMGATASYIGVGVRRVWPLPPYVEEATRANTGVGTGGAKLAPTQVSGCIRMKTSLGGPRYRGRIFPPFPSDTWVDNDGKMTGAGQTALLNISAAIPLNFVAGAGGNTSTMVVGVWHRDIHTITGIFNTASVNSWATQRRRGQLGRTNILPF